MSPEPTQPPLLTARCTVCGEPLPYSAVDAECFACQVAREARERMKAAA